MHITPDGVPVAELVSAVKAAITQAGLSRVNVNRDLQVTAVQLTLNTVASTTAGGKFEFKVPVLGMAIKLGRALTAKDTHTIDLTLVPPDLAQAHEIRGDQVEDVLVEAIETIREVMSLAISGDEPYVLKDSSVELVFAITEEGTISLGLDNERKDEITHKLKLTLAVPHTT
ncbi:trypco2 family protein [Amycolatopsis speibonae]|uniref:Trypco2 family protein n=1 Tax=Amycolatopsis speibonae TaxID=1450224 RepID=A0ABV7P7J6_9PSEU